jgi:hypothetical protein
MIDANGNVVWAPENLLTYTSDLSNVAWTKQDVAITSVGHPGPTGAMDATLLSSSGADSFVRYWIEPGKVRVTYSVWLKSAGADFDTALVLYDTATPYAINYITVTGVWKKFSVSGIGSNSIAVPHVGAFGTLTAGKNFYMAQPQLERGAVARTYIPTLAAPAYGPRITYDPVTHKCLGYLAEEQRTNGIQSSQQIDLWGYNSNLTVTANALIGPDGQMTGDTVNVLNYGT